MTLPAVLYFKSLFVLLCQTLFLILLQFSCIPLKEQKNLLYNMVKMFHKGEQTGFMRVFGNGSVKRGLLLCAGFGGSLVALYWLLCSAGGIHNNMPEAVFAVEQVTGSYVTETDGIKLPYQIVGTELVVQRLCTYDGPYLEDGSGDEVTNIAALLITNTARLGTECAQVTLRWDGGEFLFDADMIPAGASVLVLEQNRKQYKQQDWTTCIGWQILADAQWQNIPGIVIQEEGYGTLLITNDTDTFIKNLCLYYKSSLEDPDIYIGGITYKAGIKELVPHQTVRLQPFHYACGYSRLIHCSADTCA